MKKTVLWGSLFLMFVGTIPDPDVLAAGMTGNYSRHLISGQLQHSDVENMQSLAPILADDAGVEKSGNGNSGKVPQKTGGKVYSEHLHQTPPTGLSVEYIRDPRHTFVTDANPEFGWHVPANALFQRGYQILIASGKDRIDKEEGDVWDSGLILSSNSVNVAYAGEPLTQNTAYFWKVRILDGYGRLSDYSSAQRFITGSPDGFSTTSNYFRIERLEPVNFRETRDGGYFIDYGRAAFGTVELTCQAAKKQYLTVHLGEKLKDGRIDRNPGGTIRYQKVNIELIPGKQKYVVDLVPDKRNTNSMAVSLPDSFPVIMPFRYVELEPGVLPLSDLKASDVIQLAYFNYFDEDASFFESSDTLLNRVWELCRYSVKATTFAGLYVDGDRERIPYEADAYLNQLSHYGVDAEYAIARRTIEYFMKHPTWPTEWQLHVALMFYQDYMYTGNTELIEAHYEALKHKSLQGLEVEDGFISVSAPGHNGELMMNLGFADTTQRLRDIVDWPQKGGFGGVMGEDDGFVFRPVNTVVNALYYQNLEILAEFARLLKKPEEEDDFRYRSARLRRSMNEQLFNAEGGYYTDGLGTDHGSVHANMFPLAFGIVPEAKTGDVTAYLKKRGMACSVYGAQYLMEAVYKAGDADYGLELLTATHDRSWYNMIRAGSTITMEAWDMKYKPNSDWNHAWGAVPANIIPRYLWGIRPGTPGFSTVTIQPQMSSLTHSKIKVPTIRGSVTGIYRVEEDGTQIYEINLPGNMAGELIIPRSPAQAVTLNGMLISPAHRILSLKPGKNLLVIWEENM